MNERNLIGSLLCVCALVGCRAEPEEIIVRPPITDVLPGEQRSLTVEMSKPAERLTVQWNGRGTFVRARSDGLAVTYTAPKEPGLDTITAEVWMGKKYLGMVSTAINVVSQGESEVQEEPEVKAGEPPGEMVPKPPTALEETPKKATEKEVIEPSIEIIRIPPAGAGPDSWGTIGGGVQGIENVRDYRIVVFAYTDKWYVQPWTASPYTKIRKGGKWETGTHLGFEYAALLVRSSYKPPAQTYTLPEVGGDVLDIARATPER